MAEMTDAYLCYDFEGPPQEEEAEVPLFPSVNAITLYGEIYFHYHTFSSYIIYTEQKVVEVPDKGEGLAVALARHGYIAVSPEQPRSALSIPFLELYRVISSRCPSLGIQAFTRVACDMQLVRFYA